ncbi:MAG: transposase [Janthinobacterium lividum]
MSELYIIALVPDELWAKVKPLLPQPQHMSRGGRPRAPDRAVLAGILFVLRTGIRWNDIPAELGCSGDTCCRRLREWHVSGTWTRVSATLSAHLDDADELEWSRVLLDPAIMAARKLMSRPLAKDLLEQIRADRSGTRPRIRA